MHHCLIKRALHQHIHSLVFQAEPPLLIGQQLMCRLMSHLAGRRNGEGKNHRLQSFLLPKFQNPVHKQHMTAVKPVKLSQRNGASPLCFK